VSGIDRAVLDQVRDRQAVTARVAEIVAAIPRAGHGLDRAAVVAALETSVTEVVRLRRQVATGLGRGRTGEPCVADQADQRRDTPASTRELRLPPGPQGAQLPGTRQPAQA
jgi:hypothetical protein